MPNIDQHTDAILIAFAKVIRAEDKERLAKTDLDAITAKMKALIGEAQIEQDAAWAEIAALMGESGEFEVTLPGQANDFRIGWNTPRESVDVPDVAAVPDEFVKIERKAKLKEIGEHLKKLRDQNAALPNWARFERGERKLQYKVVKKSDASSTRAPK